MQNISSTAGLKEAIHLLEIEQTAKGQLLKEQFHQTYERLKPVNILKSTLKDITSSPYLVDNILGTTLGLATGYFSKKLVVGASRNIFRKLLGSILQIGVLNLISRNTEGIKTTGRIILQHLFHKEETKSKSS